MADNSTADKTFAGHAVREVIASKKKLYTIAWNSKGDKLATGGFDQLVRTWTIQPVASAKPEKADVEFKGHTSSVDHLAWHPDHPDQLASTSGDQTVRLWDARAQKAVASINTGAPNLFFAWSPDGKDMVVTQRDGGLKTLDMRKLKVQEKLKMDYEVNEVVFNIGGNILFLANSDGTLEVLQYPSMQKVWSIRAHTSSCYCLAIDKLNRLLATGGADALVGLWSLADMVCVNTLFKIDQPVRSIGFSHDGRYFAYATEEAVVDILDAQSGEVVAQVPCKSPTDTLCWNPKKPVLAFVCEEKDNRDTFGAIGIFAPAAVGK